MQLGTCLTNAGGECRLDVHVDVLEFDGKLEFASLDDFLDLLEAFFNGAEFLFIEQSRLELGPCMGDGAGNVMPVQAPVIGDGFSILLHQIGGSLSETSLPHASVLASMQLFANPRMQRS